jgi:hypothetical protein
VALQRKIAAMLEFSTEYRGRAMRSNLDELGLSKGDRLIPSSTMPDVALFEKLEVPFVITFFKWNKTGRLTDITPLYKIPGVTCEVICIDLLHSWHLGGCAEFVGEALMFVLQSGLYTQGSTLPAADAQQVALLKLKADLWAYYHRRAQTDPEFKLTGSRVRSCILN